MMVLIITPAEHELAAEIVTYSEGRIYRPGKNDNAPGHDPRHEMVVPGMPGGVRCVFSITELGGQPYRVLTMSIYPVRKGRVVSQAAAEMIAALFGFTGGVDDWVVDLVPDDRGSVICLAQVWPGPTTSARDTSSRPG